MRGLPGGADAAPRLRFGDVRAAARPRAFHQAVVNPCPAVADKVFCVDVDQTGILFMRVLNGRATSVVADFSRNVHSLEGLDAEVSALVESSTLVDDYCV